MHFFSKQTPNSMVFGREVTLPLQAVIGQPMESDYESDQWNYDDYLHGLKKKFMALHVKILNKQQFIKNDIAIWKQRSVYLGKVNLYGHMSRQEK